MIQSNNQRILIIAPSWVGDMVMAQSLFIALKKNHPDCVIDVLAPAWCKPLLDRMPEVRNSFNLPFAHGELNIRGRRALGKFLRGQYDQSIVLPNSFKSALLPWFADISQRTGWRGEIRFGLLNDLRVLDKEKYPLMVQRFIALAHPPATGIPANASAVIPAQAGISLAEIIAQYRPKLAVGAASSREVYVGAGHARDSNNLVGVASATIFTNNVATEVAPTTKLAPTIESNAQSIPSDTRQKFAIDTEKKWIGLCPGAEFGPAKRWPSSHYAQLANLLIEAGFAMALFGSTKDQVVTCEIIQLVDADKREKIIDLAGKTQLAEAVDLLAAMELVVSNDSGLMHIAAAVDKPVVALYGSTSPGFTPPLAKAVKIIQSDIACSPCFQRECPKTGNDHLRCLNELSPATVFNAVQQLLPQALEVRA